MEDPTSLTTAVTTTVEDNHPAASSNTNTISDEDDDEGDEFGDFADAVASTQQEGDTVTATCNGIKVVEADAEDCSNNSDTSIGLEEYEDAVAEEGAVAVAAAQLLIENDKVSATATITTNNNNNNTVPTTDTTDELIKLSDESLGDSVEPGVSFVVTTACETKDDGGGGTATTTTSNNIPIDTTATISCSSNNATEDGANDDNNNSSRDTLGPGAVAAAAVETPKDEQQPHLKEVQWSNLNDATSVKVVHDDDDDVVVGVLDTTARSAFPASDDELGDGVGETTCASVTAAAPEITTSIKIQNDDDNDNDDFGDFDGATPAAVGVTDAKAAAFEAEVNANGDDDDDDDFGDFDDAVPPVKEAASNKKAAAPDDDDDDDFGDFGDASLMVGETANAATTDEEAFGDFGGAQIVSPPGENDDDNDFGDFDGGDFAAETPSASHHVEVDDFGNFDKSSTESYAASQLTVFPDSGGDPILDKLRLVFPKLFARYNESPDEGNDDSLTGNEPIGDTSSPVHDVVVTVQSVLTPLETPTVSHGRVQATNSILDKLFQDTSMFKESASTCIVAEGGKGPFAHTSYPIGGFYTTSTGARLQLQNQIENALPGSLFPDVVRVPLSASKESSLSVNDRFSPPNPGPRKSEEAAAATMANHRPPQSNINADPSINVASPTETERPEPSEQAKNFLRRIPNLSYMLSSTLSIPNKR